MKRENLIQALAAYLESLSPSHPLRVAIDGVDAAGKTTFARELAEALAGSSREVIQVSADRFLNPTSRRYRLGADSPLGFYQDTYNYPALINALLKPLGPGGDRGYQTASYDKLTDRPFSPPRRQASPDAILLVDGIFLLRPLLEPYWDITLFLHCDFEVTLARGSKRDAELIGSEAEARQRYLARYIPGQQLYFAKARPLDKAKIVIDNRDLEAPVLIRAPFKPDPMPSTEG